MINYELRHDEGILVLHPDGPLETADFTTLAEQIDAYLEGRGKLRGVLIRAKWPNNPGSQFAHHAFKQAIVMSVELEQRCINPVRLLSVDMVQKANSGHPGLPLGAAAMSYVLWMRWLKHNPKNPHWFNRALLREYGFTVDNVCMRAKALLVSFLVSADAQS